MQQKCAIIIPCYNNAFYLDETIASARDQTHRNLEIILVDDGTIDVHQTQLIDASSRKADKFIRFPKNRGVSAARNEAIKATDAEFILPLDADDLIHPEYLKQALLEFSKANSKLGIVYCKAEYIGSRSGPWILPEFQIDNFLFQNSIFCTALFKKAIWTEVGGYDETLLTTSEDWDFWIRIIEKGYLPYRIDRVLFYYRLQADSRNTQSRLQKLDGRRMMFDRHPSLYYESYLRTHIAKNETATHNLTGKEALALAAKKLLYKLRKTFIL